MFVMESLPGGCTSWEGCSSQTRCLCIEAAHTRQSSGRRRPASGAQSPPRQNIRLQPTQEKELHKNFGWKRKHSSNVSPIVLQTWSKSPNIGKKKSRSENPPWWRLGWEGFLILSIFLTFSAISSSWDDMPSSVTSARGLQYWSTRTAPRGAAGGRQGMHKIWLLSVLHNKTGEVTNIQLLEVFPLRW